MSDITPLLQLNFPLIFLSVFIIIIGLKAAITALEWFGRQFGIELKAVREKRENHELLLRTARELTDLEAQHKLDVSQSIKHDQDIKADLARLTAMFMEKEIEAMRWEILDFASALSSGRKYSKEQFDHVLSTHGKYEKLLEEQGMKNGQVDTSMEVVNEYYKEKIKNGF